MHRQSDFALCRGSERHLRRTRSRQLRVINRKNEVSHPPARGGEGCAATLLPRDLSCVFVLCSSFIMGCPTLVRVIDREDEVFHPPSRGAARGAQKPSSHGTCVCVGIFSECCFRALCFRVFYPTLPPSAGSGAQEPSSHGTCI